MRGKELLSRALVRRIFNYLLELVRSDAIGFGVASLIRPGVNLSSIHGLHPSNAHSVRCGKTPASPQYYVASASRFQRSIARGLDGGSLMEIVSEGVRDAILPGDMKDLMNKVTKAKKAAEANLIVHHEETSAVRSQANTARLLADNPTLMRLRELEVLERAAASGKLNVILGEKGLADRVINLFSDDRRLGAIPASGF